MGGMCSKHDLILNTYTILSLSSSLIPFLALPQITYFRLITYSISIAIHIRLFFHSFKRNELNKAFCKKILSEKNNKGWAKEIDW